MSLLPVLIGLSICAVGAVAWLIYKLGYENGYKAARDIYND